MEESPATLTGKWLRCSSHSRLSYNYTRVRESAKDIARTDQKKRKAFEIRVLLLGENTRDRIQMHALWICITMETGLFVGQLLANDFIFENKLMWFNWTHIVVSAICLSAHASSLRAVDTLAKPFPRYFQLSHSSLLPASWLDIGAKFKQMESRAKSHALLLSIRINRASIDSKCL